MNIRVFEDNSTIFYCIFFFKKMITFVKNIKIPTKDGLESISIRMGSMNIYSVKKFGLCGLNGICSRDRQL
jgi:hypothetical protein